MSAGAHLLGKSVDVFTSTYAYTDGFLALIQHATALLTAAPTDAARVDRARLVGLVSQTRAANRFMGTLNSVAWFFAVSAEPVPRGNAAAAALWLRALNQIKALLMVLYHPLEHAAFFHDAGVLHFLSESAVARLWRLACSVWLAYVICDMPTNFLQLQQTLEPDVRPPGPVSVKSTLRANQIKRIKTDVLVLLLLRNFVDLPLVLHFSLDGVRQVLSPRTRVVLSLLSSLLNIARLWRRADLPAADQDDDEDD